MMYERSTGRWPLCLLLPSSSVFLRALCGGNPLDRGELGRLRPKRNGVSDADWLLVVQMADRLAGRITHHPTATLKEQAKRSEHWYTQAVMKLFGLGAADEEGLHRP